MRLRLPTAATSLRPERPQFAVLVTLLLLSFGLTSGLAWHAWSAAQGEEALQDHLLEQNLRAVGRDWMDVFDIMVVGTLQYNLKQIAAELTKDPESVTAVGIQNALLPSPSFPTYAAEHASRTAFSLRLPRTRARAEQPAFAEWVARIAGADKGEPLGGSIYAAVRFDGPDPEDGPLVYLLRVDEDDQPTHAVGYRLSNAFVVESLHRALQEVSAKGGVIPELVEPADLYALSAIRASDGFVYIQDTSSTVHGRVETTGTTGMVHGLEVRAGLKPTGLAALGIRPVGSARNAALLTLLTTIGLLIGAAGFVVRRETELSLMRARFVAGVSHELRTPLAQIRMFAETLLLGRVRTEADRRRSLEIIDQEARRLSHLVDNILMFSKADQGTVRISPETTRISVEVAAVVRDFIALPKAAGSDVRLELQEDVVVPVDTDALRQIVNNLMDNAVKYGPGGQRVTVGLALFDTSARVWVDDEGPGIPAMDREQVFQSFFRLRRDEESRVGGSGIGLAVVRELATLHGGEAWAEEAPGGGARLLVSFPHAELRVAAATSAAVA